MAEPRNRTLSVTGLGYVGLPVAVAFARNGWRVIAFDVDEGRVAELRRGEDRTGEVATEALSGADLVLTHDPADLAGGDVHIVTVPTPISADRRPDLRPLLSATRAIGRVLKAGDIVVYESTVYPGATEDECVPVLEAESGLSFGTDFAVGYSPERINPGDRTHRFEDITKIVSASDDAALDVVSEIYGSVVSAGIHRAPSIKVAEAAKVIENTQRDLNIALMNELSLIFDRLGLRTKDVLEAAQTKWNFLPFTPGLVGGHCIGVDPYYLTSKAESVGYLPEVILAGRRVNDGMGVHVAQKLIKSLARRGRIEKARVGILGLTFKEDVPDLRNSRVPDIVEELREYGLDPMVHDPLADPDQALAEYGITLSPLEALADLDGLVLAVGHRDYVALGTGVLAARLRSDGIIIDVKSVLDPAEMPAGTTYWSL
jgi:UDP-N-acetyl-D-galactosamine dehydrogenase